MYKILKNIKNKNMLKYFIIVLIILLILSILLMIKIETRIVKRVNRPLVFKVLILNKIIYYKRVEQTKKRKSKFYFKLADIFETDLNVVLKSLKKENFFVTLILEYGTLKKVTVIPTFNSDDPNILPYLGVLDWYIVSSIKNYIDSTFSLVSDDYYQIILLKEDTQGLNFEIYVTVSILEFIIAIFANFKVFFKLFKKKEDNYE